MPWRAWFATLAGRPVEAKRNAAPPATGPATPASADRYVAVVLSAHHAPRLHELSAAEVVAPTLEIAGQRFADSGAGDWQGFYDWLRDGTGHVIGVHQWIDDVARYPFSTTFAGVDAQAREGWVRIFFGPSRDVDEAASCSQDFGNNRLLLGAGAMVLTYQAADDPRVA